MTRIAVFSDLHFPHTATKFDVDYLNKYMEGVQYIFGLGDYSTQKGLDNLYGFGKLVYAVQGNTDAPFLKETLQNKIVVTVEEVTIGLMHGWGEPHRIRERIAAEFPGDISMICYGHTHESYFNYHNDICFFNPGSFGETRASFGIITIDGKKIDAEVINLSHE